MGDDSMTSQTNCMMVTMSLAVAVVKCGDVSDNLCGGDDGTGGNGGDLL